jgi:hypothetical protein
MLNRIKVVSHSVIATLAFYVPFTDARASDAERVAIIRNATSAISQALADDYSRRRGVTHIVTVHCPDSAVDALAKEQRTYT